MTPWAVAHQAPLSAGKNTGVGNHFLLQGIFLTQGPNLRLLLCWQILYLLSPRDSAICSALIDDPVSSRYFSSLLLGWPKYSFRFSCMMVWKNTNFLANPILNYSTWRSIMMYLCDWQFNFLVLCLYITSTDFSSSFHFILWCFWLLLYC